MGLIKRGKKRGEEGYGQGRAHIAAGDDVLLDEESMVETLLSRLESPDYRPPTLPAVAMELMQVSQRPDVELDDVIRLLEQDSLIAGRVLKLVQSPIYSGASKLSSLRDALVRLGLRTLRDLVMEIAMNLKVFRSPDYSDTMELLRRHSNATAHISQIISRYTPVEGEHAFLLGLMHDVGIAGTLLALSESKGRRKAPPDLIAIWPAVDRVHGRAAELMATHWELPAEMKLVLANHHQVIIEGYAHPLAATVAIADDLAHELGYGVVPKEGDAVEAMSSLEKDCIQSHHHIDRSPAKTLEHSREALQLGDEQLALIREEAETRLGELSSDSE